MKPSSDGMAGPAARKRAFAGSGAHTLRPSRLRVYLAVSALLNLALWMLLLLPNFLTSRGWSSQEIGWAVGCYFLVNLVCQALSGHFAAHHGNIRTALWGAALGAAGGLLYLASLAVPGLIFLARALHGAGSAMIYAGALLELLESVPLGLRGTMIGYFGLPGFVMLGIGPVAAEWFVYRWGFPGVFVSMPLLFGAIALVLARLMPRLEARRTPAPLGRALAASVTSLAPILAFSVSFGFCFSAWNSFLAPAVRAVGPGAVSMFGGGYATGAVATRLGLSHRLDTGGRRLAAIALLVLYGAALSLIPIAPHRWQLLALGAVCGMVHGTYYPSLSSIAAERFPAVHATQALSLYISANALGLFLGPPTWGFLADRVGYPKTFAAAGALMALATIAFVPWHRRTAARAADGDRRPGLRLAE